MTAAFKFLCERQGIAVREVIALANRHPRVNILEPGCGVGGHCISVDPWFIVAQDPKHARLIRMARQVNDGKAEWCVARISQAALGFERDQQRRPVIACLGLAFKPDIDDLRESPAPLRITRRLIAEGWPVLPVEPNLRRHEELTLTPVEDALRRADIVALLVKHRAFRNLGLAGKTVLDFCGLLAGLDVDPGLRAQG